MKLVKIYCKLCGKELDNDSNYCGNCSTNLETEDKSFESLKKYLNKLYEEQNKKKN